MATSLIQVELPQLFQPHSSFELAADIAGYATSFLIGSAGGQTGDGRPITIGGSLTTGPSGQGRAYEGDGTFKIAHATPSRNFVFGTDKDFTFVIVARKRSAGVDTGHIAGFGATGGSSGNTLFRLIGGAVSANAVRLQAWDATGATFCNTDSSDFGWNDLNYHGIVIKGRVAHSGTDNGGCAYFADGRAAGAPGGSSATNPSATTFNVISACGGRRGGFTITPGPYDVALCIPLIGIQMPDEWCIRASHLATVWQTCFEPQRIVVPVAAATGGGAVGAATETDAALPLSGLQILGAGLATETDTAQALGGVSIIATGLSTETDDALALTPLQLTATGRADETDAALALTSGIQGPVGVAVETDEALALAAVQIAAAGRADETDTALTLNPGTSAPVGLATESDTAFALAAVQLLLVGVAAESDLAFALGSPTAAVEQSGGGGWAWAAPRKKRHDYLSPPTREQMAERVRKQREALGILPKPAQKRIEAAVKKAARKPEPSLAPLAPLAVEVAQDSGVALKRVIEAIEAVYEQQRGLVAARMEADAAQRREEEAAAAERARIEAEAAEQARQERLALLRAEDAAALKVARRAHEEARQNAIKTIRQVQKALLALIS